jgi:regulator of protease activity HflC (stomatin/prohibitin superfamily)
MLFTAPVVVILLIFLLSCIRIMKEYERGVMLTFGRFTGVKGPGIVLVAPLVQRLSRVDLRVVVLNVPPQDVITRDNVSVKVSAVVYFRQYAQTTLRSVVGQHELDALLAQRDRLNQDIQRILDQATDAWGIKVASVEIKDVDINESMIRAIARQAEAERTRRAKVIHAEGEKQAAAMLVEAAQTLAQQPQAMQLRYLQTLADIASEKTSTIVFPLPLDLIRPLLDRQTAALPPMASDPVATES